MKFILNSLPDFFADTHKVILKTCKGTEIAKKILRRIKSLQFHDWYYTVWYYDIIWYIMILYSNKDYMVSAEA